MYLWNSVLVTKEPEDIDEMFYSRKFPNVDEMCIPKIHMMKLFARYI